MSHPETQAAAFAVIENFGRALTKRQREVLRLMATAEDSEDGLLVYERGRGYVGDEPISGRTFYALLRACAIRHIDGEPGGFEIYAINETGRALAAS